VVEPHEAPCCAGSRRWVFDPDVVEAGGQRYIFYGSYFGGISARRLSADGLRSDPATQTQIAIDNRYEGAHLVHHGDYWYLFVSATDCCRGPLTGYSVFAGRSTNLLGPYVDRSGASLLEGRVGGSVVLSMNGNRFVGPGHIATLTDFAGQDWMLYHAVDVNDPYFAGAVGFTKRPLLMDPLDWIDGWPTVRGGFWASDKPEAGPAAQPGDAERYRLKVARWEETGEPLPAYSEEFDGTAPGSQWSWVRQPAATTYRETGGVFSWDTQAGDLFQDSNNASVLVEPAPQDNYVVETRMSLSVPPEGCCFNYVQGGLVVYADDDNFVKLATVSIWDTRQTEWAKELSPVPAGYPRYGNTVVGPPGQWTYLRIAKRTVGDRETYRAFTSRDGVVWERGGVWTHALGSGARIGLVSMGGSGFTSAFDYVHVWTLRPMGPPG
jgi:arabinan endo-1,5-alpha-L-arabinosidase